MIELSDILSVTVNSGSEIFGDSVNITLSNFNNKYSIENLDNQKVELKLGFRINNSDYLDKVFTGYISASQYYSIQLPHTLEIQILNRWKPISKSIFSTSEYIGWYADEIVSDILTRIFKLSSNDFSLNSNLHYPVMYFDVSNKNIVDVLKDLILADNCTAYWDANGKLQIIKRTIPSNVSFIIPQNKIKTLETNFDDKNILNDVVVVGREYEYWEEKFIEQKIYEKNGLTMDYSCSGNWVSYFKDTKVITIPTFGARITRVELSPNPYNYYVLKSVTEFVEEKMVQITIGINESIPIENIYADYCWGNNFPPPPGWQIKKYFGIKVYGKVVPDHEKFKRVYYRAKNQDLISKYGYLIQERIENNYIYDEDKAKEIGEYEIELSKYKSKSIKLQVPLMPFLARFQRLRIENFGDIFVWSYSHRFNVQNGEALTDIEGYLLT